MKDADCVEFLQRVLPRLHMRWPGFRKVRSQVCKRLDRRLQALSLPGLDAYAEYLEQHPAEWRILDGMTRVTVTRFYRDKQVFGLLEQAYLPLLIRRLGGQRTGTLKAWSAGCASGEEPYSLILLWEYALSACFPGVSLRVLATDADERLLLRAREACYGYGSIKNLPEAWRRQALRQTDSRFCLLRRFCSRVEFRCQDLRAIIPKGPFDLVMCRNLVFTYFDAGLQLAFLDKLRRAMSPGGILLLGVHESLPEGAVGFEPCAARWGFYRLSSP
jgi:chemotaxis protein methyltransferase CheR